MSEETVAPELDLLDRIHRATVSEQRRWMCYSSQWA